MKYKYINLSLLLYIPFCNCSNYIFIQSNEKIYYNQEMGYSFKYPKSWEITYESLYQSAAQQGKNEIDANPPIYLSKNGLKNNIIRINGRQCTTELGLPGNNWICLDNFISSNDERFKIINIEDTKIKLPKDIYDAILIISKSFKVLKINKNSS